MCKKILILTEAGVDIGYGHYTRCLALFKYLSDYVPIKMVVNISGDFNPGGGITIFNWLKQKDKLLTEFLDFDTVLIDSYLAGKNFFDWASGCFNKVIVLDDYKRLNFKVDFIINPNVFGNEIDYEAKETVVGGADYVILREEIRKETQKYKSNPNIKKIVITLGGSDFRGLLPILTESLKNKIFSLILIAGNNTYAAELERRYPDQNIQIYGFIDAEHMKKVFLEADLVISACGQTLHELTFLGVPFIGICLDKDQIPNMEKYFSLGILHKKIFWNEENLILVIEECINELESEEVRQLISFKQRNMLDGKGVEKISKMILNNVF